MKFLKKINSELENDDTEIDSAENELLLDTIINLKISKHLYNIVYNTVADNLQEIIPNSPMQYQEALNKDMQSNGWSFLSFSLSSSQETIRAFD